MNTQHRGHQAEAVADATTVGAWSWIRGLFHRASTSIIDDIPADIEACEMCRETDCGGEKFQTCQTRLSLMNTPMKPPLR
jgi:hypothetical protein